MGEVISLADFRKSASPATPPVASVPVAEPAHVVSVSPASALVTRDEQGHEMFDYEAMSRRALLWMVRDILSDVMKNGLPQMTKLLVEFRTDAPGVDLPASLRLKFPQKMTILFDKWWKNLIVEDDKFMVTMSFSDVAETIVVPFNAMTVFADPTVEFGLRFGAMTAPESPLRA